MRWIAPSLLGLALAFSTGGVAIVGQAGSPATESSAQGRSEAEATAPTQAAPSQCEDVPGFRRTSTAKPRVLKDAEGNKSIVLNTSGYNYVLDGEWRPNPLAVPQDVPEGVLPDHLATPPASPEAK